MGAGDFQDIDRAWAAAVGVEILMLFIFSISSEVRVFFVSFFLTVVTVCWLILVFLCFFCFAFWFCLKDVFFVGGGGFLLWCGVSSLWLSWMFCILALLVCISFALGVVVLVACESRP